MFSSLALPVLLLALYIAEANGKACTNVLPGIDRQARGVDVTKLDLVPFDVMHKDDGYMSPVVEYTCDKGTTRTFSGVTYNIPDQVWTVSDLPSGSFASAGTVMMTSSDVRKSYSVNAGVDVQTKKFGFSASASYSKTQSTLLKNTRKTTSVHASFSSRRVDFVPKTELRFGARAQTAVNALPSSYTSNPGAYEEFIRQFGTHYITWGKFGGIMMMYLETSTSYIEKKNIEEVSAQASATFGQVLTVKGGTSHSTTQIDSSFTSATNSLIRYYGGTANLMAEKGLSAWQPTISAQPWLFSTKLVRLSELVRDANKKAALDQAISDYLMRVYLNVELRRVLNTLPSHMRSRWEVTSLNSRITTMVAKYPLVESEVDALGKEAMDTYFKLFLEEDLSQEELFYANSLMNKVDFSCPTGQSIFEIQSWHSDWHDDRRWAFKCSYLKDLYALGNCYWTDWLYQLGTHNWKYSCNGNRVLKGWYSEHHDWSDTRTHKLQCCEVLNSPRQFNCWWTDWANAIMKDMKVSVTPSTQIIRGVAGQHSDWHDDDRWYYEICTV